MRAAGCTRCSFGRRWRWKVWSNALSVSRKVSECSRTGEDSGRDRFEKRPLADGRRGTISSAWVVGCVMRFKGRGGALEAAFEVC